MLDRVGGEVARATSLVRYAPGTSFPSHKHPGGEEILVISGAFSDENGDYPTGWYLRNPPGSSHRPHSDPGALILVKLYQMRPEEAVQVRVDTGNPVNWSSVDGRQVCSLFVDGDERVFMERLVKGDILSAAARGGAEIFVVSGRLSADGEDFPTGSWLRLPSGAGMKIFSVEPTLVFVKEGPIGMFIASGELS